MREKRIEVILEKLKANGIISTLELTEELNVTEMNLIKN